MSRSIIYDKILIGSGLIFILEAIHLKLLGKKILIIEKNNNFGGAWKPIKVFGINNVENAIHYFLPNNKAINFIKNQLNLKVILKKKKFIFLKRNFFSISNIKYDSIFSKFITEIQKRKNFFFCLYKYLFYKRKSFYLKNGSIDLYKKIKKLIVKFNLNILYNIKISEIKLDNHKNILNIKSNKANFLAKKIGITHSTDIFGLKGIFKDLNIKKKVVPRPSVHFLVEDNFISEFEECIFNDSRVIKYIHDVSNYLTTANLKNNKIFIIALKSKIKKSKNIFKNIFQIMKNKKIIGLDAKLLDTYWQDIYLPSMNDKDLKIIKKKYPNYIDCYKSEDFTASLYYNLGRWKDSLMANKL